MPAPGGNPPVLKRFGQHFLADKGALEAIAAAVAPLAGDTILEIGPGRGALTDILARFPNHLVAVEIDHLLSEQLRERYGGNPRVRIIEQDFLEVDLASVIQGPFVIAGNVPYYITTPILFHVMRPPLPRHAVFLVQKEVADRITARPGRKEYGALSVNVQALADTEIIRDVPPTAFRPPPKVDSAVIRIVPRPKPLIEAEHAEPFRRFVQAIFGMRRKQIGNVLKSLGSASSAGLESLSISPTARPETLTPSQFVSLFKTLRIDSSART